VDGAADRAVAFVDVRLFDGRAVHARTNVVVERGVIAALGAHAAVPEGAEIVDGQGRTLLPGLIDAHTHVRPPAALRQALAFGVTTELEMAGDPAEARRIRERQRAGLDPEHADLRSAGDPVTAPGGHGTEYGRAIPTVTSHEELPSWVDARIVEGSDYIKVIFDAGTPGYLEWPVISKATLAAAITAAHARGRLAVVHVTSEADALSAIEDGADGLAHVPFAGIRGDRLLVLLRERNAFVISTLAVFYAICDPAHGDALADDARIARLLDRESEAELRRGFPMPDAARRPSCTSAHEAASKLVQAGVSVLAGTDATNPGTVHGASLHDELALLVGAGMSPIQALRAATALPAERFDLRHRGVIAPGRRADLLLVDGDPTHDIESTRAIVGVWKAGRRFDHARYLDPRP